MVTAFDNLHPASTLIACTIIKQLIYFISPYKRHTSRNYTDSSTRKQSVCYVACFMATFYTMTSNEYFIYIEKKPITIRESSYSPRIGVGAARADRGIGPPTFRTGG